MFILVAKFIIQSLINAIYGSCCTSSRLNLVFLSESRKFGLFGFVLLNKISKDLVYLIPEMSDDLGKGRGSYPITICLKCRDNILYGTFNKHTTDQTKAFSVGVFRKSLIKGCQYKPESRTCIRSPGRKYCWRAGCLNSCSSASDSSSPIF